MLASEILVSTEEPHVLTTHGYYWKFEIRFTQLRVSGAQTAHHTAAVTASTDKHNKTALHQDDPTRSTKMIQLMYTNPAALPGAGSAFTREDHRLKELGLLRAGKRAPRRSQTQGNYRLPDEPSLAAIHNILAQFRVAEESPRQPAAATPVEQPQREPTTKFTPRRRPPLGPPRRSYSATDKEPVPTASTAFKLQELPAELHYAIFDFLDPIDSTCLGLVNKHFYAIHRRMNGSVPLSSRREGPNELEWAWHLAGSIVRAPPAARLNGIKGEPAAVELQHKESNPLSRLRVRGQGYCRICGVTRCELQKHIKSWLGEDAEYCSITQKFGPAAREGAKAYCYRSKPGDHKRCGRHYVRKSKVVLQ